MGEDVDMALQGIYENQAQAFTEARIPETTAEAVVNIEEAELPWLPYGE